MRTEKVNAIAIIHSFEDHAAMEHVETVLEELLNKFGRETTLMSTETGEIVQMEEIPRVLGILSALREHRCWKVSV